MKFKKILLFFIFILVFILSFITTKVSADTGPKPYVEIEMELNEGKYYVTLLSQDEEYGPWRDAKKYFEEYPDEFDYEGEKERFNYFKDYVDKDGFYIWNNFKYMEGSGTYRWGYYPPKIFKILIYDIDNDLFIAPDDILDRYAFKSFYRCDAKDVNNIIIEKTTSPKEVLYFFLRLTITLIIELLIALLFLYKKWDLLFILGINVITQLILNVILLLFINGSLSGVMLLIYLILEILVTASEILALIFILKKINEKLNRPSRSIYVHIIYGIVANFASFIIGLILQFFGLLL